MSGIQTKKVDYQYALEGVSFAEQIIKNHKESLDETIVNLNNPEVMGGETGKEFCKRLGEAVEVVGAVLNRYNAFSSKVSEICVQNGAQVDNNMMDDFDAVQKAFAAKADDVSKFNGTKKA